MRVCATAFAVLMFAGIAHAQSYGPPTYSVGDTWTIKEDGTTRDIKVIAVDADSFLIEGYSRECPSCRVLTDKNLSYLKFLDADGKPASSETETTWFPLGTDWKLFNFPLEVGKKWRISAKATVTGGRLGGRPLDYTVECAVEAYEDVQTPAGTFKAFRIRREWLRHTRPPKAWTEVSWFAPNVKQDVKFTTSHPTEKNWELVSYSLK